MYERKRATSPRLLGCKVAGKRVASTASKGTGSQHVHVLVVGSAVSSCLNHEALKLVMIYF
tara:strand:+ start:45 stop:227 length:183 start_codon:yes stop_codon:yes gene_type:complete